MSLQRIQTEVQALYDSKQIDAGLKRDFEDLIQRAQGKTRETVRVDVGGTNVNVDPRTLLKIGGIVAASQQPPPPPRKPVIAKNVLASTSSYAPPNTNPPVNNHIPHNQPPPLASYSAPVQASGPSLLADLPPPPPRVFTKPKVPPGLPPPIESLSLKSTQPQVQVPVPAPTPPSRQPTLPKKTVIAIQQFIAQEPTDLAFQVGDRITILGSVDDLWYEGELNGKTGIFPKSFVK